MKSDQQIQTWVNALQSDPSTALATLYRLHRDAFIAWSSREHKASEEAAKDAFQEALIALHRNAINGQLVEGEASIKTYLFTLAKNKLIEGLRKEVRQTYHFDFQAINGRAFEGFRSSERMEDYLEMLEVALKNISADCGCLIKLFFLQGFDMESIAREMGLKNANSAKSKKVECMKRLTEEMNKRLNNDYPS